MAPPLSPDAGDDIGLMYGMRAAWRSVCEAGYATELLGDVFTVELVNTSFQRNSCAGDGARKRRHADCAGSSA